jgi:uncharacterized protein YdaU (DUF1376 family)
MKSPAFQFYPSDYLSSQRVQMLTLEEEGAYIRLLCYCWQHGSIPADPEQIARLVGKGASTTLATTVQAMFKQSKTEERLVHDRLEREKCKQAVWREKSAEGGRKSAEKRKGGSTTLQPPLEGCLPNATNQKATLLSSSSSSSSNDEEDAKASSRKRFSKPTLEEVSQYGLTLNPPFIQSSKFIDYYEANGWKVGKNPMKDWKAAVRNWQSNQKATQATRPTTEPFNFQKNGHALRPFD